MKTMGSAVSKRSAQVPHERHRQAHGHQATFQMTRGSSLQPALLGQSNNFPFAGPRTVREDNAATDHCQLQTLGLPGPPLFIMTQPTLLPGTRCYTDASTTPDSLLQVPKKSWLGSLSAKPSV